MKTDEFRKVLLLLSFLFTTCSASERAFESGALRRLSNRRRDALREPSNNRHIGPPKRDAEVHGSLNATVPSITLYMQQMHRACQRVQKLQLQQPHSSSSFAHNRHYFADANNYPAVQDEAQFLTEVARLTERLHRISPDRGSAPSLRRRIALLGICWSATTSREPGNLPAYAALVRQMFDFYTDAMRFRTALYFLHISKAGGTSFCASAYENACRDPNVRNGSSANSWRWNCWSRPHDDGPKWTMLPFEAAGDKSQPFQFRKFRKDPRNGWWAITDPDYRSPLRASCGALQQEVLARRITFLMNENFLPGGAKSGASGVGTTERGGARSSTSSSIYTSSSGSSGAVGGFSSSSGGSAITSTGGGVQGGRILGGHLCPSFMNVVLLRKPIERLISHRKYLIDYLHAPLPRHDWRSFVELAPIISNDYFCRVLGGEATYRLPLGNLTNGHLEAAFDVLRTFDLVLTLESLDKHSPILIRRGFGWSKNKMLELNRRRDSQGHPERSREVLSPEDSTLLRSLNALDSSLYERGAELAEADFEFFRQVELLSERGRLLEPMYATKHRWKASPGDPNSDPGTKCQQGCGYTCQVEFPPE